MRQRSGRTLSGGGPATNRFRSGLLAAAALLLTTLLPAGAAAAASDPCAGRRVRSLGGPHAVSREPIRDLADLKRRLPELEAGMRDVLARDAALGAGVADALFAAIRDGSAVAERKLGRGESFRWMVYQPKPGQLELIQPPCVALDRDYDAFEITVEVPEPPPAVPADARCALGVTRNCERQNPTITLDTTGSSARARVERGGQPVPGQGPRWAIADPSPYSADETFVVHAEGTAPPAHTARVYRFVLPKACSNLTFAGEEAQRTLSAAAPPATCEKSVTAKMCKPWAEVAVAPQEVEVHHTAAVETAGGWHDGLAKLEAICADRSEPVALDPSGSSPFAPPTVCCGHGGYDLRFETRNAAGDTAEATAKLAVRRHDWVLRTSLVYYSPTDGEQERGLASIGPPARESYEVDQGLGVGVALERRFSERWGLEGSAIFGKTETTYELTLGGATGEDDHPANFYAFTVGPNLHWNGCKSPGVYAGLFAGYAGLADPNYWVFGHHFHADLAGEFVWGAQLGLDWPFDPASDWGLHAAVRYFANEQETDAGSFDVDPLLVEVGLSYRF